MESATEIGDPLYRVVSKLTVQVLGMYICKYPRYLQYVPKLPSQQHSTATALALSISLSLVSTLRIIINDRNTFVVCTAAPHYSTCLTRYRYAKFQPASCLTRDWIVNGPPLLDNTGTYCILDKNDMGCVKTTRLRGWGMRTMNRYT